MEKTDPIKTQEVIHFDTVEKFVREDLIRLMPGYGLEKKFSNKNLLRDFAKKVNQNLIIYFEDMEDKFYRQIIDDRELKYKIERKK